MTLTLEETLVLEEIHVDGYEQVLKVTDKQAGLTGIICIHNTTMGPALGGTRIHSYNTFEAALNDAMRLARGMTYKSALAEAGLGGGKSVIIADPKKDKTEKMLLSFGRAVERLKGRYICAEDAGCTVEDISIVRRATSFVVGLSHEKSSGDPGLFTSWGTFRGMQSVLKKLYGSDSFQERTVAIQGLGSVGARLADLLFWNGAKLIVCDIDKEKTQAIAKRLGAQIATPEEILSVDCDILAPCAMGGIINSVTIPKLRCKAVAGCANNQLLRDQDGDELMKRGILYAPDFVINAGGLINVTVEIEPNGYHPSVALSRVNQIYDQLMLIYEIAEQNRFSTHAAAMALGDYRLKYGIGKRQIPIKLHHI